MTLCLGKVCLIFYLLGGYFLPTLSQVLQNSGGMASKGQWRNSTIFGMGLDMKSLLIIVGFL